jgi:predicted site-specific integrase-resolvase
MCNGQRMPNERPDLIGSAEACDILDIDRATLSRWVSAGRIDYWVRLPGKNGAMLFDRRVVLALADEIRDEVAS